MELQYVCVTDLSFDSLGEVSIEFKRDKEREEGEEGNSSSLPRKQRLNVFHKKQPSLPGIE